MRFDFDRLDSVDRGRAFFSTENYRKHGSMYSSDVGWRSRAMSNNGSNLPAQIDCYSGANVNSEALHIDLRKPSFIVQLRAGVNNIELSTLRIMAMGEELSFDWRTTFTRFFQEEKVADARLGGKVSFCRKTTWPFKYRE